MKNKLKTRLIISLQTIQKSSVFEKYHPHTVKIRIIIQNQITSTV